MTKTFEAGYVLGQASVYIEQVLAGAKLAAQLGCSKVYMDDVVSIVRANDCLAKVEERGYGRIAVWIFRHSYVSDLIDQLSKETTLPTASGVWSMGKLFGYSDSEIGAFLEAHGLTKSISDSISNQPPCSGTCG